jgi:prepilin-type N-terminal cleavage/methylation domain-containing protein/prepilin-type processing-associated H-X9-DG protein
MLGFLKCELVAIAREQKMKTKRRKGAFTLIELLVVISVIALLLAILVPALKAARDQAKMVLCQSNLKSIFMAWELYLEDNNSHSHPSPNEGKWEDLGNGSGRTGKELRPTAGIAYWGIAYHYYARNKKMFHCPSMKRVDDWWVPAEQYLYANSAYGLNRYLINKKISDFSRQPNEVIICQDHIEQVMDGIDADTFSIGPSRNINLYQWRVSLIADYPDCVQECFRHRGVSNTLWLDGHTSGIEETTGENIPNKWYDPLGVDW